MIDVIDVLRRMEEEKKQSNIHPSSVLLSELMNETSKLIREELKQAVADGKIEFHKTLNDVSFNIKQ